MGLRRQERDQTRRGRLRLQSTRRPFRKPGDQRRHPRGRRFPRHLSEASSLTPRIDVRPRQGGEHGERHSIRFATNRREQKIVKLGSLKRCRSGAHHGSFRSRATGARSWFTARSPDERRQNRRRCRMRRSPNRRANRRQVRVETMNQAFGEFLRRAVSRDGKASQFAWQPHGTADPPFRRANCIRRA
jgi:hypothetical protein